ncbi:MAG: methylmalonyl-CoA mutase, partial [Deltaproteobacteria bacterium]|nr:methylmalonyl-CoA mutase [Deltaproteobacteria bacterium]
LGGTQSLHTNSMDEAFSLPTEEAVSIALKTQQVIAYETGVTDTVDPLAGSYYIEYQTNRIEAEAREYIQKIEEMGGAVAAVENGYIQKEIQESSYHFQKTVENGERVVVGINKFQTEEAQPSHLLRVDPVVGEQQCEKLKTLKTKRDQAAVNHSLEILVKAARGEANLMPPIIEAVRAYTTLGEICNALRSVFGEYEASVTI